MSWSRQGGRSGPRGYHHGNLKEALIRAALELIAEKGPAGFTFAEAARWAGVSPAAPYRHFRDRDELLADVARRGFDAFATVLAAAWDERASGRVHRLRSCRQGLSALRQDRTGLLFGDVRGRHPARRPIRNCARPGERAFAVLRTAAERLVATMPAQKRPPVLMMALHIWAMSHGIASLFGRGDAAKRALADVAGRPARGWRCWSICAAWAWTRLGPDSPPSPRRPALDKPAGRL